MGDEHSELLKTIHNNVNEIKMDMKEVRATLSDHNTRLTRVEERQRQQHHDLVDVKDQFNRHRQEDVQNFHLLDTNQRDLTIKIAKILGGLILLAAIVPWAIKIFMG